MKIPSSQVLLLIMVIALSIFMLAALWPQKSPVPWIVHNDRWLRDVIRENPVRLTLIAWSLYFVTSLIPGFTGKSIVVGWLFGLTLGVIIVNTALVAAALTAFVACRLLLKSHVESRFAGYLGPIRKRVEQDGALYLLTLRLAHAPFSLMNYAAGAATEVRPSTFWWTTQLGLLPGNFVFVYAGTRLPTLEELLRAGPIRLIDGPMLVALSASVAIPWFVRWGVRILSLGRRPAQQLPHAAIGDENGTKP